MVGRDAELPLRDIFVRFRDLVSADMDWTDSRKVRFRKRASYVKIATLFLTAASTVVLGIQAIPSSHDPGCRMKKERLHEFFVQQQDVWSDVSRRWVEFRKLERSPSGDHAVTQTLRTPGA